MKEIQLTQGKVALVDDADFDYLSQFKWHANRGRSAWYAEYSFPREGKKRKIIRMHRFLLNPPKGMVVDHINHNGLDNRRENLRVCTHAENMRNRKGANRGSRTGLLGAHIYKPYGNYKAGIILNRKHIHLGYYPTPQEAAHAYQAAAKKLFGEFAGGM